jgi:hypothetical protein
VVISHLISSVSCSTSSKEMHKIGEQYDTPVFIDTSDALCELKVFDEEENNYKILYRFIYPKCTPFLKISTCQPMWREVGSPCVKIFDSLIRTLCFLNNIQT